MSGPHVTNTNLKPLPEGWEWIPLGKYVENHDGRRIPIAKKERESRSGLFPYYGASGVIDTIDGFTHDGEFLLVGEDGANLLTRSKPLAFLTKGKVWVNNHAHVLRCKPGYPNAYLAYFINSIDLSPYVTGTAQPKLSQSMMNKILIPVAPLKQQVEIVAELEKQFSRLDEAVANLQRVKANLKRYKASVLKDAVEGRLVPTEAEIARREGRSFETGEQLLQRILETRRKEWKGKGKYKEPQEVESRDLPELPEGWAWCGVEHVAASDKNSLKAGPFGSALKKEFYVDAGYKIYGQEQVIRGDAEFGDYFIDEEKYRQLESCAVRAGDVLVSLVGTAGKVLVLPEGAAPGIINPRLIKLSLNQKAVLPEYLAYVLQSPIASRFFKAQAHGGTMDILNLGIVKSLPIALPPVDEQRQIVDEIDRRLSLVRGVDSEIDANLKRAQALRQSTLSKAFSL